MRRTSRPGLRTGHTEVVGRGEVVPALAAAGLGVALVPTAALTRTFAGALRRLKPALHRDGCPDVRHRGIGVPAALLDKLS